MMRLVQFGKLMTGVFWALVAFNLAIPLAGPLGLVITIGGPAILGIHTLEAFFFIRKFKHQLPEMSAHALQVLLFGVFHFLQVMEEAKTSC